MLSPECKRGAGKVPIKQGKTKLTSEISEINRLPVGIQELNHRVVAVLDAAADGGDVSLHHRHVFGNQVLTVTLKGEQRWNRKVRNDVGKFHLGRQGSTTAAFCRTCPAAQPTGRSAKTTGDFEPTSLTEEELAFSAGGTLGRQRRNISRRVTDPGSSSRLGLYGTGTLTLLPLSHQ